MPQEVLQTTDSGMIIIPDYPKNEEELGKVLLFIQTVIEGIREKTIVACSEPWINCVFDPCSRPNDIKQCVRTKNFELFRLLVTDLIPHIVKKSA